MVEIHCQRHLRVQAGREPDPPWRPVLVGSRQRRRLQVSQDQAREEVLVAGERRGLPRSGRCGGRQRQPGHPVEGHMGAQAQEVPAAGEERQVQEALGGGGRHAEERRKNWSVNLSRVLLEIKWRDRGPRAERTLLMLLLFV